MDNQIKSLMSFLKPFKDNNNLTDEEFVQQLAEAVLDHEDEDAYFLETFEDFRDLMIATCDKIDKTLQERFMRS
jgi:hypothetical protein